MYNIITNNEYFDWFDEGLIEGQTLKHAQDGWIKSLKLDSKEGQKIAEIGGGNSRILSSMSKNAECWNIDKLEGDGNGPISHELSDDIKIVKSFMGSFDSNIPDNYFDSIFSISVMEHIPIDHFSDFYKDCRRILKPNGLMAHAIDIYITDEPISLAEQNRIESYLKEAEKQGFKLLLSPQINRNITFESRFVSNPDYTMGTWNGITASSNRPKRESHQVVSIKLLAHG